MSQIRATLFETLRVSGADGSLLEIGSPTLRSLAAYLILHRTRPLDRRKLAFAFWPDAPESAARRNLRQYLHHLRQALQPLGLEGELLAAEGATVQLNPAADLWVDVEAFEQGVRTGASLEEVEEALNLYTADLLSDLYDEWIAPERERLRELFLRTLDSYTRTLQTMGQFEKALTWAHRWAQMEALDEIAQQRMMGLYALLGERTRALQQYHSFAETLRKELNAEPLPETQDLLRVIQRGGLPAVETESAPPSVTKRQADSHPKSAAARPFPLIGRKEELRQLERALENASKREGQTLIVKGEAGIGKTRLVQEYFQRHPQLPVLHCMCYELDSITPYAPLRNSLKGHAALLNLLTELRSQSPAWIFPLAPLLPDVGKIFPYGMGKGSEAPMLRDAWVHLLTMLARQSSKQYVEPFHLVLDDLHWADMPTWELLAALGRVAAAEGMVVIGLCREEDLPTDRLPLLRLMERSDPSFSLSLPRLNFEETIALAQHVDPQRAADPLFVQRLYQETEGNPFFVIETMRAVREAGPQLRALPPSIQRVIEARLDRLSPAGQEVLSMAAAIGRSFTFALLQRISRQESNALIPLIEEWTQRGLVYESEVGYDFRHDQFRQAAYGRLSRARREYTHRQIAEALTDSLLPPEPATLAYHYARSDHPLKALPYLTQAGEQALHFRSYHEARQFGQQAISLLGQMPGPAQRAERVDANLQLAQAYAFTGDLQRALELLSQTENLASALGDEARLGQVFRRAAQFFWLRGQPQPASDYAHRTLRVAEEREDPDLLAASLRMLGRVSIALGAFDDAIAHLVRYVNQADDETKLKPPPADLPIVLGYLGIAYARVGAWERALQAGQRGLTLAEGRSDAASASPLVFARMQLAMIQAGCQSWQTCLETLEPLLPSMESETLTPPLYMALALYGLAQTHLGKTADGISCLRTAIAWAEENHYRVFDYLPRLFLAEGLLLAGKIAEAEQEAQQGLEEAQQRGDRWAGGVGLKLLADIRIRQKEPAWIEIETLLVDSMRALRQIRARPDLARTYLSMRRLYDRAGQIAWAVDCHFRATTIFDELGMTEELRKAQGQAAGERRGAVVIPNLPLKGPNIALSEAEAKERKK